MKKENSNQETYYEKIRKDRKDLQRTRREMMRNMALGAVANLIMVLFLLWLHEVDPAMREALSKTATVFGIPPTYFFFIMVFTYILVSIAFLVMEFRVLERTRLEDMLELDQMMKYGDELYRAVMCIRDDVVEQGSRDMYFSLLERGFRKNRSFCAGTLEDRFIMSHAEQHGLDECDVRELMEIPIADLNLPTDLKDRLISLSYGTFFDLGMICTDRPSLSGLTEEEIRSIDTCLEEDDFEYRCGFVYHHLMTCPVF